MSHPELIHRKALAARVLVWEALYALDSSPGEHDLRETLRGELESLLQARAGRTVWSQRSPNSQSLEKFVALISADFLVRAREHLSARPDWFEALTVSLQAGMQHRGCEQCCETAQLPVEAICTGGVTTDDETVDRGGLCLVRIRELFDYCLGLVTAYYQRFAGLPEGTDFRASLHLQVQWEIVRPMFSYYHLDASTRRAANEATVRVDLGFAGWSPSCYFALFPLFIHELFAHAFANRASPPGSAADETSLFEEGWMDYVAWWVVRQLREERALTAGAKPGRLPLFEPRFQEAAKFHTLRHDYLGDRRVEVRARSQGRCVAERFHQILRSWDKAKADEWLLQLSLRMNVAPMRWEDKDLMVKNLGILCPAIGESPTPLQAGLLLRSHPWVDAGDVDGLNRYLQRTVG